MGGDAHTSAKMGRRFREETDVSEGRKGSASGGENKYTTG